MDRIISDFADDINSPGPLPLKATKLAGTAAKRGGKTLLDALAWYDREVNQPYVQSHVRDFTKATTDTLPAMAGEALPNNAPIQVAAALPSTFIESLSEYYLDPLSVAGNAIKYGGKAAQAIGDIGKIPFSEWSKLYPSAAFALENTMGAARANMVEPSGSRSILEHLAAQNLPEAVMRKAESLRAMYGEDALAKIVKEYADKGVPLFSHDLPMDEASRMARAKGGGFNQVAKHSTQSKGWAIIDPEKLNTSDYGYIGKGFYSAPVERAALASPWERAYAGPQGHTFPLIVNTNKYIESGNVKEIPGYSEMMDKIRISANDLSGTRFGNEGPPIPKDFKNQAVIKMTQDLQDSGARGIIDSTYADSPEMVSFFPQDVRSQFAAFDPRMKDSRFLLALKAGAIPLAGLGAAASLEGQ